MSTATKAVAQVSPASAGLYRRASSLQSVQFWQTLVVERSADLKSAKQQVGNLRYFGGCADTPRSSRFRAFRVFRGSRAFTLIELLVAVTLMSFIVLGLMAMLSTTQRAFRASLNQTDVQESGRILMDMITRELQQMTPAEYGQTKNCIIELEGYFANSLEQGLPGTPYGGPPSAPQRLRTNVVEQIFFITQENLNWNGIGYCVWPDDASVTNAPGSNLGMVGTLYRYAATTNRYNVPMLYTNFAPQTPNYTAGIGANFSRIADGIVHFSLRAFATNGFPVGTYLPGNYSFGNFVSPPVPPSVLFNTNFLRNIYWSPAFWFTAPSGTPSFAFDGNSYFVSNAVPAYLELEVGILEPQILDRYRSMTGNAAAQYNYLSNHVAQVHIYRQRIAVPNVDAGAYR